MDIIIFLVAAYVVAGVFYSGAVEDEVTFKGVFTWPNRAMQNWWEK